LIKVKTSFSDSIILFSRIEFFDIAHSKIAKRTELQITDDVVWRIDFSVSTFY